jgi:monofunctional biosynthetic peptidoglycan transglycosylase
MMAAVIDNPDRSFVGFARYIRLSIVKPGRHAWLPVEYVMKSNWFYFDYLRRYGMLEKKKARRGRPPRRRHPFFRWVAAGLLTALAMPVLLIVILRWAPVPVTAFMVGQWMKGQKPEYHWVSWSDISSRMPISVVASEDQNFPHHWGFDFKAINKAIEDYNRNGRMRGASTISQQTAKNLFLWSDKSLLRKGLEAGLTLAIELCWPKQRILEVYLNIAQFGPDIFGVGAASRKYFNVPPSRLNAGQAALLAATLPNPSRYRITPPSPFMRQRAADIQHQVALLGGPGYLGPQIK